MKSKYILFLLRTYNDIDHITPIIWKSLNESQKIKVFFTEDFDISDYRIQFLNSFKYISLKRFPILYFLEKHKNKNIILKLISRIVFRFMIILFFIQQWFKREIISCVNEWSGPKGNSISSLFITPLRKLNIPIHCVPHGMNIYLNEDINQHLIDIYDKTGKWPDFTNRNAYTSYVVQTKTMEKLCSKRGISKKKLLVMGSARFCAEWLNIQDKLCPSFTKELPNKQKIVFFLPHWSYNVNKDSCLKLIHKIAKLQNVYLIIKAHTRGTGGLSIEEISKFSSYPNIEISPQVHSFGLIKWADIIINFGSSIGLDALIMKKPVINPNFLHTNKTVFDHPNITFVTQDDNQVIDVLMKLKEKDLKDAFCKKMNSSAEMQSLFNQFINGSKKDTDVLGNYYRVVTNKTI